MPIIIVLRVVFILVKFAGVVSWRDSAIKIINLILA